MLKYILDFFFPKQPFETQKPSRYITFDEYHILTDRQKLLLHSKYDVYLIPDRDVETDIEEDD